MKIGLASFAFRWAFKAGMPLEMFLEQAASFGAEVVQLCENSGVDRLDEQGLKNLANLARQLNLTLECGGSGGEMDQLEAGIRRTACLGGNIYRCVLDSNGLAPDQVVTHLQGLLPLLRDCGVMLCAENHFRFSPATLRRIVTDVGDPAVAVCLDPLNSIAQLIGTDETVRELIDLTHTAHIKDALILRSGTGFTVRGVALGEGQLDLATYLEAVGSRAQTLLLESWMDPVDGDDGVRTLEQEAMWARDGLALIKKLTNRSKQ